MTVWTPTPAIAAKVIGLAWRGSELLVAEVEESDGRVKGLRPLGGAIEFGETREQALVREFAEELGCAIEVTGAWHTFENLFEHEGARGHEFVFAANVRLGDAALYRRDRFAYLEHDGARCCAVWIDPRHLPPGMALYPAGLPQAIARGEVAPG